MHHLNAIIRLAALIVISLVLYSTAIAANNDSQFYRNQEKHFSIFLPKGWSIEKGRNPHVVVKSRSADRIASIAVTITGNAGNGHISKSFPEDMIKKYIDIGWDVELLDSGKMTCWNEEGMYMLYIAKLKHMNLEAKMLCWQLAFNHLNESFMISFSVGKTGITDREAASYYDKYNPYFLKSLSSFVLEDYNR